MTVGLIALKTSEGEEKLIKGAINPLSVLFSFAG
jgi:hypothetical protein